MNACEMTTDLFRRLRHRNNGNGVVMLCQVGDGAGFGNSGWTDAIAMQTWPSKTLTITGYEVKASRPDWLKELDNPDKNAKWQAQCHEWYIVAPKDVVKTEELPTSWGLMIPKGTDGLRIASRAETKVIDSVSLQLMAAVFRAAGNERARMGSTARLEMLAEAREELAEQIEESRKSAATWEHKYVELAEALGSRWTSLDDLKARARSVAAIESDGQYLARQLKNVLASYERAVVKLKEIEKDLT